MIVRPFILTAFRQNTRIVACEQTRTAMCIDPGETSDELINFIRSRALHLQCIALTHGHLDHVGGTAALHSAFPDAEILLHKDEEDLYFALPQQPLFLGIDPHQAKQMGMSYEPPPKPTRNWIDGEIYSLGEARFKVMHCPGHTRGHVVLAEENERAVFVGDCLFAGSIGRTDLPGGNFEQLMDSIQTKILALGDDFTVYSGHGPETTVGIEKRTNPFLTEAYRNTVGRYL